MEELFEKYKDKKVFITNITGFKGCWLTLILKELGAKVYGIGSKQRDYNHIFNQAKVYEKAEVYYGDIRDTDFMLLPAITLQSCDYVFDLGYPPTLTNNCSNGSITIANKNILGSMLILELIKDTKKPIEYYALIETLYEYTDENDEIYRLSRECFLRMLSIYIRKNSNLTVEYFTTSCIFTAGGGWEEEYVSEQESNTCLNLVDWISYFVNVMLKSKENKSSINDDNCKKWYNNFYDGKNMELFSIDMVKEVLRNDE